MSAHFTSQVVQLKDSSQAPRHRWRFSAPLAAALAVAATLLSLIPTHASASPARFAVGPDSNQMLLLSSINAAKKELLLNVYTFESDRIADAVIAKARAGVTVRILLEGQPVGRPPGRELNLLQRLKPELLKNSSNMLYWMGMTDPTQRRYRYDHAKYIVVDGHLSHVSSDNFGATGHADPGNFGSRGWDIAIDDITLATQLRTLFARDVDPRFGDIANLLTGPLPPAPTPGQDRPPLRRTVPSIGAGAGSVDAVQIVASPNSLPGISNVMRAARQSLAIEEMSVPLTWLSDPTNPGSAQVQNPLVTEAISAAQRGAQVRVLLNDDNAFGGGGNPGGPNMSEREREWAPDPLSRFVNYFYSTPQPPAGGNVRATGNRATVDFLNDQAQKSNLPLEARIVSVRDVQINYIHNKGMIADGNRVLIGSINGTQNSIQNNREIDLDVMSASAGQYFLRAFDWDWTQSPKTPSSQRR